MKRHSSRVVGLSALLLTWSAVSPRLPTRWNPLPHIAFSATLAFTGRESLGLRPPALWDGLRWGGIAAAPVISAVAAATARREVREGMAVRDIPAKPGRWLLLRIPFGTVWSEEVVYRGILDSVATRAFGPRAGGIVAAAVFGLSHVPDARAGGDSVLGTVLVTGAAGALFSWLYRRSGSLAAPILAHLAINEAGAVAALAVQRGRVERRAV